MDGDPEIVETETHDWLAPEDEAFVTAVAQGVPPDIGSIEQALTVQRVLAPLRSVRRECSSPMTAHL